MSTEPDWQCVLAKFNDYLPQYGFECYPFKIGWYNECVKPVFAFDYAYDTLAVLVLSAPRMFDLAFKPFLQQTTTPHVRDPIDECMQHYFHNVKQTLASLGTVTENVEEIHDYELHHNHRPKVLMQTAGHVAGAARFYQRQDVQNDPWPKDKKIFPVAIHPKYGGWFAFRGVFIFPRIPCTDLQQVVLPDSLSDEEKVDLLNKFNGNWKDGAFRNVGNPQEKYSDEQLEYFNTLPADRHLIIEKIKSSKSDAGAS